MTNGYINNPYLDTCPDTIELPESICQHENKYSQIHVLNKLDTQSNTRSDVFPLTTIQAVHDGVTGASLEAIIDQFNCKFLQFQGTKYATRNIVPVRQRRKGFMICYVTMNGEPVCEMNINDTTRSTEDWGNDENWKRFDEVQLDWALLEILVKNSVNAMIQEGTMKVGIPVLKTLADRKDYENNGEFVYVIETATYYIYDGEAKVWSTVPIIHIGNDEPSKGLWVDPQEDRDIYAVEDEEMDAIREALAELQDSIYSLSRLMTVGIIPGDVTSGYRRQLMLAAEPEKPEGAPDVEEDDSEDKPDISDAEKVVPCVCCKMDTIKNFAANKADLVDGEILFYTDRKKFAVYYGGQFFISGSGDSSDEDGSGGGGGASIDDLIDTLYNTNLEKLNFFTSTRNRYEVTVDNEGKWVVRNVKESLTPVGVKDDTWGVYVNHLLCINSVYCGGNGSVECACSHNYVELANGSNEEVNLNGLYLLYTDSTKENANDVGYIWKVLPLNGIIKPGGTFVIRGAACNDSKSAFIQVDSYDMEWKEENVPVAFNLGKSSFYLCVGESFRELLDTNSLNNPWVKAVTKEGYIDSCGFGSGAAIEGSANFLVNDDWNKVIFVRWFMLEPAKQGNKNYGARKTTDLWTYINLEKQTTKLGNSIQYYFPDDVKALYKPVASYLGKNFFTVKTTFDIEHANYINITFGIQATDNGNGATRCFNWVSVGYYDEYVEYRKVGDTEWTKHYSITENDASNPAWVTEFIEHYKRFRWCASDGTWVTTHKCIIKGLEAGQYEYRICRDNNFSYASEIYTFKVEADEDVTSFKFIQTSDQQGFNWAEYTAWWKTADAIKANESNYNFLVNTGDITQSGNRVSEWLDYYTGKLKLSDKVEMFTVGNNDLCGYISTELTDGEDATSKYSHINVLRYFCFELDVNNTYSFNWNGNSYPIYSLYSFNYGAYHFVCLNSEIAQATSKMYVGWESDRNLGDETFADQAYAHIEDWLKKDLQLWKGVTGEPTDCSKCVVYMHEMPFTILTYAQMTGESARKGSHLNYLNSRGDYRYSRLFKKYGIRLVMGGHKHTYSISKPIYDAPAGYITNNSVSPTMDIMGSMTAIDSLQPVIQVTSASHITNTNRARYEVVSKINAPTYVMSQASGYKLVSNKDLPSIPNQTVPWLLSYFKSIGTNKDDIAENVAQHRPMYIVYELGEDDITVTAKQVMNIWNVNVDNKSKSFDINNQLNNIEVDSMTLSTISAEDKAVYGITDLDSFTINL